MKCLTAETSRVRRIGNDAMGPRCGPITSTPRAVEVLGFIVLVLVLLFVAIIALVLVLLFTITHLVAGGIRAMLRPPPSQNTPYNSYDH